MRIAWMRGGRLGFRVPKEPMARATVMGVGEPWPSRIARAIVIAWNLTYCWFHGHDFVLFHFAEASEDDGSVHCPHCCTVLGRMA